MNTKDTLHTQATQPTERATRGEPFPLNLAPDDILDEKAAYMLVETCTREAEIPEPPDWFNEIPFFEDDGYIPDTAEPQIDSPEYTLTDTPTHPIAGNPADDCTQSSQQTGTHPLSYGNFCIQLAKDVVSSRVDWLWKGWLPLKSLAIMAAPPGVGKSTLAISLGAMITRGGPFPDGSTCQPGAVLHWSTEDHQDTVLQPHYEVEHASLDDIGYVSNINRRSGLAPMCHSLKDQDDIIRGIYGYSRARIEQHKSPLRLLIIDNILNVMGGKDGNSNTDVRATLDRFSNLAGELNICILGIAHTNKGHKDKGLIEGVMGAQSFVGISRVLMNVGKRHGEATGILARGKVSNESDYGGFEYTIERATTQSGIESSRIQWGDSKPGSADELIRAYTSMPDEEQKDATTWLLDRLKFGPVDSAQITEEAREEGFGQRALRRARQHESVAVRLLGNKGCRGGSKSLLYRTDLNWESEPDETVKKAAQTVMNNAYLAAKEGYMQ